MSRLSFVTLLLAVLSAMVNSALDAKDPLWQVSKTATPLARGVTCTVAPIKLKYAPAPNPTTADDTAGNYTCMADEACCTSDGATFCCPKKYELVCGCEGDTCYSCLNDGRCLAGMEDVCFSDLGFIIAIIIVVFIILIVATFVGITARLIYIRAKKNKS